MFTKSDVLDVLSKHIGAENGERVDFLVMELNGSNARDLAGERRFRELIARLRLEGHHICAHPTTGYFIARNEEELNRTCLFLYERAMASLTQVSRMKRISLPDLRGQLKLPT